jgi:hypothetical protein
VTLTTRLLNQDRRFTERGSYELLTVSASVVEANWGFIALVSWVACLALHARNAIRQRTLQPNTGGDICAVDLIRTSEDESWPGFV